MNKNRTILLLTLLTLISFNTIAQESAASKFQLYGFIRNEAYYDTYKGVDAAMDQFYLLPLYTGQDANGEHFNQQGSAHLTAIATRIGVNISGPDLLGSKTTANIEVDFAGVTTVDPVLIRIRKAYYKLSWENSNLLIGQNWHPFWGGSCFPSVASLNTGAPFQTFNRSPQVNYTMNFDKLSISAAALYENQYVSRGFYANTNSNNKTLPKRNGAIPEMVLTANYNAGSVTIGAGAQFNSIQPIDRTRGSDGKVYVTNEKNNSASGVVFAQYKKDKLKVLAKSYLGQNMANMTMLGGYGVSAVNNTTGAYSYTNYTHSSSYLNIVYGKKYQVGLFAGYSKNLGTSDALADMGGGSAKVAGFLTNIQSMYRVAPHFAYNVNQFRFVAEYEMTSADYGSGIINLNDGLYSSATNATNNRFLLMMMFFF